MVLEKSRQKFIKLVLIAVLLTACGSPDSNAPTTTATTQATDRILVSLTEPLDGESYPISAGLSVRGEAISDGSIARM